MEKIKHGSYEKGKFYMSEPPKFGTLTSKINEKTYFYPIKEFKADLYKENLFNLDLTRQWKESFYMLMNSYDKGGYLKSNQTYTF